MNPWTGEEATPGQRRDIDPNVTADPWADEEAAAGLDPDAFPDPWADEEPQAKAPAVDPDVIPDPWADEEPQAKAPAVDPDVIPDPWADENLPAPSEPDSLVFGRGDIAPPLEHDRHYQGEQGFQAILQLPDDRRAAVWRALAGERQLLTSEVDGSSNWPHDGLRALFDATPDSDRETLQNLLRLRFRVGFQSSRDIRRERADWGAGGLRRSWTVLEKLPPEHVEENSLLSALERYQAVDDDGEAKEGVSGYFSSRRGGYAAISYNEDDIESRTNWSPDDPLHGVNRFDKVVRHEVGHAVDRQNGYSDDYCVDSAKGGDWRPIETSQVARTLVDASDGFINKVLGSIEREWVIEVLQGVVDDQAPDEIDARLEKLDTIPGDMLAMVKQDAAVQALRVCFSKKTPWFDTDEGGGVIGGRIYIESYADTWWSFLRESHERRISVYQFRAPGEWFAEAFAAYYEPTAGKGELLEGRDDATKQWFDSNVDPRKGEDDGEST